PSPTIALKCTKTSGPPSWEMKPYPFSGLNHFTVPVATKQSPPSLAPSGSTLRPSGLPARSPGGNCSWCVVPTTMLVPSLAMYHCDGGRGNGYRRSYGTPPAIPDGSLVIFGMYGDPFGPGSRGGIAQEAGMSDQRPAPEAFGRPKRQPGKAHAAEQPFEYPLRREFVEPDWRRLPGYRDVERKQWESAQWQRAHTVKNLVELKRALGDFLDDELYADIERDQRERATMSMLIPPQMINTMNERDLRGDPVRRYMAPAFSERHPEWTSHPMASRDSLHEADMWAVEGLTHRYPTKVLAEMIPTCPQYCGHCTRMDLVGNDTAQVLKYKFEMKQQERWDAMLDYLRRTPSVRDVVVSGGDVANLPIARLEAFMMKLLDIPNIRDVRLATKGLMGIPQHFLQDEVLAGYERIAKRAHERGVEVAIHTHINAAQQVTPLVAKAVRALLDMGFRDVRNQGVLLRGVNTTPQQLLELCFMLIDHAKV